MPPSLRRYPWLCVPPGSGTLDKSPFQLFWQCVKFSCICTCLFYANPLLRCEVQNLGFRWSLFHPAHYITMIFLVLPESSKLDFQPFKSSIAELMTLSPLRSHAEPGPEKGSVHVAKGACSRSQGQLQFPKAEAALVGRALGPFPGFISLLVCEAVLGSPSQANVIDNCSSVLCAVLTGASWCLFHRKVLELFSSC